MSHHGMHIPPAMLGLRLLPGMTPLGKTDKTNKKQRLKKTASTGNMDDINEIEEDEDIFGLPKPSARSSSGDGLGAKTGGKPRHQQLSDKVVKSLLEAQEKPRPVNDLFTIL